MTLVNLNKVRKDRARAEAKQRADENAVKFGRTKAQRLFETARSDKARAHLDGAKFDDDNAGGD